MAQKAPEAHRKFSYLLEGIIRKAQAETKCERSDLLRDVIRFYITKWLNEVQNINPLYKVSELLSVGSYAEGTKILQPDEYDYLAVIEEFSKTDMIKIDANERDIHRGLVKVVVQDEELKSKCSGLCKDGHLKCFQPINFPGLTEKRFGHILIEYFWSFARQSKRIGPLTGTPTDIQCNILLPAVNNVSLHFKGANFSAPNVFIEFEYNGMDVTVDLSPAIRYHKIDDCFCVQNCAGPAFAELVLSRHSLLLVGTSFKSDFKVTVTEAEVEYIRSVMKREHKMIYIFLKYIVNLYKTRARIILTFTSYLMKTVCIHHDIKCKEDERSIKECFKSIIEDLNVCKEQGFVLSIVDRNIHIGKTDMERQRKSDRESLLRGMISALQLPSEIETVDKFETYLWHIAENEWQKISKAEQERQRQYQEANERFREELKERVSSIVDMGFELKEVKEVMENTLYDTDLAIKILLKKRALSMDGQKVKVNDSSLGCNVCDGKPEPAESYLEKDEKSNEFPLALPKAENEENVKYEILYQRQKNV